MLEDNVMLEKLIFRRPDDTFVALINGYPYHVIPGDPYWNIAREKALELGTSLPFEPPPPPYVPPPPPTKAELMVQLQAIAAQIAALPD